VTRQLKAGILEQEEEAIARQRGGKHISTATNQYATVEELLGTKFSMRFLRGYVARINEKIYCNESPGTRIPE
jgi:hypothetical protein